MALLFCGHFDGYDTTALYRAAGGYISGGGTYEPAAGRFGGGVCTCRSPVDRAHPAAGEQAPAAAKHLAGGLSHPLLLTGFSVTGTRPYPQLRNGTPDRFYEPLGL